MQGTGWRTVTAVDLTGAWYCTEEDVRDALDVSDSRRSTRRIRAACADATLWIDRFLNRHRGAFLPITETRYFPWPQGDYSRAYRLWLGDSTLADTPISVTSGGVAVEVGDLYAEPVNSGPPYDSLELLISTAGTFSTVSTHQRQVAVQGAWGYRLDTRPAGALAEALDSSEVEVDVTDSSVVGVGDVITVDSERMVVTDRGWLSTGQTVQTTALTASKNNVTVLVTDGTAVHVGERILIESERMLVLDIAGNTLTVDRAIDGSVLAAHATGTAIYAPRTLTVRRGALGTSSATHSTSAAITAHVVEAPVRQLAIAEAIEDVLQGSSGYARDVKAASSGAGEAIGVGLDGIRERVRCAYRRGAGSRKMAV